MARPLDFRQWRYDGSQLNVRFVKAKEGTTIIRSLKGPGLALMAVFTLTAAAASAASAAEFHSGVQPALIEAKATTDQTFTWGGKVETSCNEATFTGTSNVSPFSSLTVHPVYQNNGQDECPEKPIGDSTVETTGCNYTFGSATTAEGMAEMKIVCEVGKEIRDVGPLCTFTFGSQSLPNAVRYVNTGSGTGASSTEGIIMTLTVTGINWSASGFGCSLVGLGSSGTDGTYAGAALVKAYVDPGANERAAWYE
jgi:hypothetical protein